MNMQFREVAAGEVMGVAQTFKYEGYRLMQICATRLEIEDSEGAVVPSYEIIYTFGMGFLMEQVKVVVPQDTPIYSITNIYPCAFLYENEMHDLFGVDVKMINLDYRGNLYRTAVKTPFKV